MTDGRRLMLVASNVTRSTVLADRLESADSLRAKFMGLMGRESLPAGGGLWLPDSNGIHMMFMHFPIDCVFVGRPNGDDERTVVAVRRAVRPWVGVIWYVRGAHGVLELPVGTLDASSTAVGDRIRLDLR